MTVHTFLMRKLSIKETFDYTSKYFSRAANSNDKVHFTDMLLFKFRWVFFTLQLFDQLSTSDGLLVLQVFGPITVVLSVLGVCAASLDYKPLLLVVRVMNTHTFVLLIHKDDPGWHRDITQTRGSELTCSSLLQFSTLIFVEFVALTVVASPLVQVQAQVTLCLFLSLSPRGCSVYCSS